ncbi:NAD(P)-dependent dehydrogenase (short-subunit alcohol dehydrogenase family) [Crossiella equi]|uniref:NAD(P)-dependent dehydrogenase (Short-subunit alcohol dehydrogenase family) n=1 Tax=Crossiella equi TaxID=130796 RepID=A0ABS5A761_9PSEU|nr:SDR family oxidoreductase [Crossiella equi]MBP2472415.1 NAD(P)-dependent dehydrogenase (short-subunit alcohol dehydrogenase family) [Crossiella equi]
MSSTPIPDQTGRTAVVTGASSGLGLEITRELSARGARVVMAVRDVAKGERARATLPAKTHIEVRQLDLLDLDSVRGFAEDVTELDLLVNNAGISGQPLRYSPQGVESHFATNHLGHYALTGLLLPTLQEAETPRVVTVSSLVYRWGRLRLDQVTAPRWYRNDKAYYQSKLANVLFGLELDRRLAAQGSRLRSVVAHPGVARTPMHSSSPNAPTRWATELWGKLAGRTAAEGALPILHAATTPNPPTDHLVVPGNPDPRLEPVSPRGADRELAARLWTRSAELSGVEYLTGS